MLEREMNMFENGEMEWSQLSPHTRKWYADNYPNDQIVVGMNDGGPVTLAMMNEGGDFQPVSIDPSAFEGENINEALSASLGNLAQYYQDPSMQPQWYGTKYNPETGQLERVLDEQGNPLSPIAGFTEQQLQGQAVLANAAQTQQDLADQYAQNVITGAQGGYDFLPNLYGPGTQMEAITRGPTDYVNQYINPAVNQAQQAAIANVNSSFGQGGTLGGARNARAATTAATQAALPTLTQAAQTQFQADQAIANANQQAQQMAQQYNVNLANQLGQQNVGLQNQAQLQNLQNIQNWTNQLPGAQQAQLAGGNTLQALGQQQQDLNQNLINQDIAAWNYQQNLPQQQLFNLVGLGQLAQAGQDQRIGADAASGGGVAGGNPFNIVSQFGQLGGGSIGGSGGNPLAGLLGGLFG